jgi:hypothetical protein
MPGNSMSTMEQPPTMAVIGAAMDAPQSWTAI